ncbi:MAG TPA: bifunctional precorrin-2 dehydrogenase/sirohydrochlorin ferrochelatase [Nitrospirae bacterium]|nr:bifunctional precorrin-2 dehydrogenase/sirohydrochlorin ferrochelatase [Nitrospirota bacterium]
MKYYPAFLNLKDKKAVVAGGGKVAERKALSLVNAGAAVKVISPDITENLRKLKKKGLIKHIKRNYREGDLKDAFIVVAGTSSAEINAKIAQEAPHLVNVIDLPSAGNYVVPSIVRRGPLAIAISTEGVSPAVSKAVRKEIERLYGREFALYLKFVGLIRKEAREKITNCKKREKFLKSLASEELFTAVRNRGFSTAYKKIVSSLNDMQ